MEGFLLAASPSDAKSKRAWKKMFIKLDEVSAKIIAFTDRSQANVQWSLHLMGADISTPFPGDPNYSINIDETPFCFYVRETTAGTDQVRFLAAPTDVEKKVWMKQLLQSARDGPISPRFAIAKADNEFVFSARVVKFRTHEEGKHAVSVLVRCVFAVDVYLMGSCALIGIYDHVFLPAFQRSSCTANLKGMECVASLF